MIDNMTACKEAILDKLEEVEGINLIRGYVGGEVTGYPAVQLYSASYKPEILDNISDLDVIEFTLIVMQEIKLKGNEEAERIIDDLVTAIVQPFQIDYRLGGVCDKLRVSAVKGWVNREAPDRVATITITCFKRNILIDTP